jgi:hypothetical protein
VKMRLEEEGKERCAWRVERVDLIFCLIDRRWQRVTLAPASDTRPFLRTFWRCPAFRSNANKMSDPLRLPLAGFK